ncbi:MAG: hypothetical protein JXO22_18210 [Phycisphaerae bacterium]|nr:hypothetical protein [Phycisphaerae bacterium]
MDKLLSDIGTLMRYFAAGLVALAVACAIDCTPNDPLLMKLHNTGGDWWPVLVLAAVIGMLVYVLNATLGTPTIMFLVHWAAQCTHEWRPVSYTHAREKQRLDSEQRWLRRGSEDKRHMAIQRELDTWSAMVHLLYCSAWVTLAAPVALDWFSRNVDYARPWYAGLVLLLLAIVADLSKTRRDLWVAERWPIVIP